MSAELETAKDVALHPASWFAAATAAIGWIGNKLWRFHRNEISAIWKEMDRQWATQDKLVDHMREHERNDVERFERQEAASRDRHDELLALVGDIRTDIAGLKK